MSVKPTLTRTHYCGQIDEASIGEEVCVCGWVNRRRDHGGVIFIDLRDRYGLVQVVADPDTPQVFSLAEQVRNEFVLQVHGTVRIRPEGTENPDLDTGSVEIVSQTIEILNSADTPPFQLEDEDVGTETRLRYRYIDLRRPQMQQNIVIRSQINSTLRRFLETHDFLEIETPMLTKATPEGARDYLVPSRTHHGMFFSLPQSPQLFKQLLMISGFDRYYQIVRCFRDEDLRADRQPEFTQLDIETSFMNEEQIISLMEAMVRDLFKTVTNTDLVDPFPHMAYADALEQYGTDRPDLRNPLRLVEVSDLMEKVEFKVFSAPAQDPACRVAALCLPGGGSLSRKEIDDYTAYVGKFGARGLAYIKCVEIANGKAGLQSPILKFIPDAVVAELLKRTGAQDGDMIFFGADKKHIVNEALGNLRNVLGADLKLLEGEFCPVWITQFPMFEWDLQAKRWQALHHPFTAPVTDDPSVLKEQPGECLSRAYDLVINGMELGGGSIRIHNQAMQNVVFEVLGISVEEAQEKFDFLLQALKSGCPPHGGIAFGLDRIAMVMTKNQSIREVIAFPKTQTANCPLTSAPTEIPAAQLKELNIRTLRKPSAAKPDTDTLDDLPREQTNHSPESLKARSDI